MSGISKITEKLLLPDSNELMMASHFYVHIHLSLQIYYYRKNENFQMKIIIMYIPETPFLLYNNGFYVVKIHSHVIVRNGFI